MKTVPVCADDNRGIQRVIELADEVRVAALAKASNAQVIRRRGGEIARIKLASHGDDTQLGVNRGNPRRYSHDNETDANPPRVWTLRRLPSSTADIYDTVVSDCISKKAA